MTRLEANREIIKVLSELVEQNPDLRIGQLLTNIDFYEESETTLSSLIKLQKEIETNQ